MNQSEQSQSEARRQYNETIVARHLQRLFRRLPMLSGFWLDPNLEVAEVVITSTDCTVVDALYGQVMESLLQLAAECPEAVQLMRGRTFARTVH
jgi:hypothetical protein